MAEKANVSTLRTRTAERKGTKMTKESSIRKLAGSGDMLTRENVKSLIWLERH